MSEQNQCSSEALYPTVGYMAQSRESLGPTQQQCLKHDPTTTTTGGCGSSPQNSVLTIGEMVGRLTGRLETTAQREVSDALTRAEEQGYRIGFDAAMESAKVDLTLIGNLLTETKRDNKRQSQEIISARRSMQMAAETIRRQQEQLTQVRATVTRLTAEADTAAAFYMRIANHIEVVQTKVGCITGSEYQSNLPVQRATLGPDRLTVFVGN